MKNEKHVCPSGTHNAVCTGVDDLGLQSGFDNGKPVRKIALRFEIDERIPNGPLAGEPFRVGKIITASLHVKSSLRNILINWFGHDPIGSNTGQSSFNLNDLIGKPATITITHRTNSGKITPIIKGVSMCCKGATPLEPSPRSKEPPTWVLAKQAARLDKPLTSCIMNPTPLGNLNTGESEEFEVIEVYDDIQPIEMVNI